MVEDGHQIIYIPSDKYKVSQEYSSGPYCQAKANSHAHPHTHGRRRTAKAIFIIQPTYQTELTIPNRYWPDQDKIRNLIKRK